MINAPLLDIPANPRPPGGEACWVSGVGGARLRIAVFRPEGTPRGSVIVSPGRTEAIEKYYETVGDLLARGFVVLVHDWRGQGMSHRALPDRMKGHAVGFRDFVGDFRAILDGAEAELPRPWLAIGHSMGGCLTTLALAMGEDRFSGALLSAPMLGLLTPGFPRPVARTMAWVMSHANGEDYIRGDPGDPHGEGFTDNPVTRDEARYLRNRAILEACPELCLGAGTWSWLEFAFSASAFLKRDPRVTQIAIPVECLAAGAEVIVSNADQRRIVGRMPQGRWREIEGARHELLQETDSVRAQVWAVFDGLVERVG